MLIILIKLTTMVMRFNKLIPELSVSNFGESIGFYTNIIGFRIEYIRDKPRFALLSFQGSQIMIEEITKKWSTGKLEYPFGRGINLQIEVKDVNGIAEQLRKNNYPLMKSIQENWYRKEDVLLGNREFLVKDPDGYLLRFSQDIGTKPVNKR